jgi:hypothetical protein
MEKKTDKGGGKGTGGERRAYCRKNTGAQALWRKKQQLFANLDSSIDKENKRKRLFAKLSTLIV